jgi:glucan phosphoethanolaminetransferase (alkaline phosphatase superfamily)
MTEFVVRTVHQPEYYLHLLLNPIPIYGLGAGLIALIAAVVSRSRAANICALIVVMVSAASAWPVFEFGEAGYDIMYSRSDETGDAWLAEHKNRAERLIYWFYGLGALAVLAIFAPLKWPKSSLPTAIAVLVVGCVVLGMAGYIAYPAGKVRHSELRSGPPPKRSP